MIQGVGVASWINPWLSCGRPGVHSSTTPTTGLAQGLNLCLLLRPYLYGAPACLNWMHFLYIMVLCRGVPLCSPIWSVINKVHNYSVKMYCFRTMLVSQLNAFQNCLRLPQPWLWTSNCSPYLLKAVFSGSCSLGGKAPLMLCVGGGWWDDELAFLNKSSMVIDCCLWTKIEKKQHYDAKLGQ